jgi:cell division protein FtsA
MTRKTAAGIDLGTSSVRVVVGENVEDKGKTFPAVVGTGYAPARGLRHGYIVNGEEAVESIRTALREAERACGTKIRKVFLGVGGVGLEAVVGHGSMIISRGDSEVADVDLKKVHAECEHSLPAAATANRKIIHSIPLEYRIDGRQVLGRPAGMKGMKLEARTLFVTCISQHLEDLIRAVEEAGAEVEDVMASPLAASLSSLTKTQKVAGCVLANIGAETVSIIVYENNLPISIKVFPIGSTDVTNDIALGLKLPLEEAERAKLGAAGTYSRKKLDEIIAARYSDMLELIEAHLTRIGKSGLLPAGILLSGGGAGNASIEQLAKNHLKLPAKRASVDPANQLKGKLRDASWGSAYGLTIWGLTAAEEPSEKPSVAGIFDATWTWLKQFLP